MKKLNLILGLMMLACLLTFNQAQGADYYVTTTGSDTAGAGTVNNPWKTISRVQSALSPGDTVYCSGDMGSVDFDGYARGTSQNWITYQAWPGQTVPNLISLSFPSDPLNYYIKFIGFNFHPGNSQDAGISISGASYITFDTCDFIAKKVSGTLFDAGDYAPYGHYNDCIIYARNDNSSVYTTNLTIRNCRFQYGYNAITIINYFKNVLIEDNKILDFADNGIEIRGNTGHDMLIQRNEIYGGECNRGPVYWKIPAPANWASHVGKRVVQTQTGGTGIFETYDSEEGAVLIYPDDSAHIPDHDSSSPWTVNGATFFNPGKSGDNPHSDGISNESAGTNFNIYRNIIHDILGGQGIKTGAGNPQNVRICSNLLYNTGSHALYFETGSMYIYNNTVDSNVGVRIQSDDAHVTLFNNLIYGSENDFSGDVRISNYNIWAGAGRPSNEGSNSPSTLSSTGFTNLFVNRAGRDYKLRAAVAVGVAPDSILPADMQNSYFNQDLLGANWNNPPSRGAYEYGSGDSTAPAASFTATPTSGDKPLQVYFDASDSSDVGGSIVDYSWNFGDSAIATGVTTSHTYTNSGSFTASLTVTDNDGKTATTTKTITVTELVVPGCALSTASWQNQGFTAQTGSFTAEFDATPNNAAMDGVIGLSSVAVTGTDYNTSFACQVLFNDQGYITARNAGVYVSDTTLAYTAGIKHHFKLEVNILAHTYNIYVTPQGGGTVTLGTNYAFRNQQNSLANLGIIAEAGSLQICDFILNADSITYGDLSGDGALSAYDAALAARIAVGLDPVGDKLIVVDVSGDGFVTAYDAALIAQRAVGLIDRFPVEG